MTTGSTPIIFFLITEEYASAAFYKNENLFAVLYEGKEKVELFFEVDTQIKPISKARYETLDISTNAVKHPAYGILNKKKFDWRGQSYTYEKLFDPIVENIKAEFERLDSHFQGDIPLVPIYSPAFEQSVIQVLEDYLLKKGFHILPKENYIPLLVSGLNEQPRNQAIVESFGERIMYHYLSEEGTHQKEALHSFSDWDFEKELVRFVLQRAMRQVPDEVDLDNEVANHAHRAEDWLKQIREERKSFITVNLSSGTSATATIESHEVQHIRIQSRELAQRIIDQTDKRTPIYLLGELLLDSEIQSLIRHRGFEIEGINEEQALQQIFRGLKRKMEKQEQNDSVILEETLIKEAIPQFLMYQKYLPKRKWESHCYSQNWDMLTVEKVISQNDVEVLPAVDILLFRAQQSAKDGLLSTTQLKDLRSYAKDLDVSESELEQRLKALGIRTLPLKELLDAHIDRRKVEHSFPSEYYPQLLAIAEQNGFSERELEVFFRQRNLKLQTREEILDKQLQQRLKGKILSHENFEEILIIGDKLHYTKADIEILMDKRRIKLAKKTGVGIFLVSGIVLAAIAVGVILVMKFPNSIPVLSEQTSTEQQQIPEEEKITDPERLIGKYAGLVFHTELKRPKNSRLEILAVRKENGELVFTYAIPQDRFRTWKGQISLEEQIIDFMPPENARHKVGKYRFYQKNYRESDGTVRRSDIILKNVLDSTLSFSK